MTKAKISEYDAVAANNTDVNGVNIAENCPPSGMNNMGREIMAALKRFQTGSDGDGVTVGGNLVVSGTSTLSTTSISSADINAGTIDATAIGGSTAAAGSFTTLNTSGQVVFNDAGADVDFRVEGDTDANLLFVDADADRVGVGLNSPAYKFVVKATNGIAVERATDTDRLILDHSGIISYGNSAGAYNNFDITSSNNSGSDLRMRIDSSGNVGIGTTSPGSKLTIADNTSPRISCSGSGGTKANGATLVIPITGAGGCIVMVHNSRTTGANQFTSTVFAVCGRSGQGYAITQLSTKNGDAGKSFTLVQNGSNSELLYTNTAGENCDVTFSVIGM